MHIQGPLTGIQAACERVLRTLPRWFGIEESLLAYAQNTADMPTFVAMDEATIVGFLSLQEHFPQSWEVNCMAVDIAYRGKGLGRKLQESAEAWLLVEGAAILQVKTLAASHPSAAYAETRKFYEAMGYKPVEVFPTLWGTDLPVLQLAKPLQVAY
jgi:GNAT superfamily N-acetyltransferase